MNRLFQYLVGLWQQSLHAFERGELIRTFFLALIAFVIAYLAALGVKLKAPNIGELWEWVIGLWVIFLFVVIAPFRLWLSEREKVDAFEEAALPKLEISDPIESSEPKGQQGKAFRTWRLKITNISTVLVKGCYAKKKSFINRKGHQSDIIGIRFKWSVDSPKNLQTFKYQQSFDIPPGGHEYVDIACMDERITDNPTVWMLYAISGSGDAEVRNAIPTAFFPHELTVEVCAENVVNPIEITYKLYVNDEGLLRMERVQP